MYCLIGWDKRQLRGQREEWKEVNSGPSHETAQLLFASHFCCAQFLKKGNVSIKHHNDKTKNKSKEIEKFKAIQCWQHQPLCISKHIPVAKTPSPLYCNAILFCTKHKPKRDVLFTRRWRRHNFNTGRRTRCYGEKGTMKKGAFKDCWTRRLQWVRSDGAYADDVAGKWRRTCRWLHMVPISSTFVETLLSAAVCLLALRQRQASTRWSSALTCTLPPWSRFDPRSSPHWMGRPQTLERDLDCLHGELRGQVSRACPRRREAGPK